MEKTYTYEVAHLRAGQIYMDADEYKQFSSIDAAEDYAKSRKLNEGECVEIIRLDSDFAYTGDFCIEYCMEGGKINRYFNCGPHYEDRE